MSAVEETGAAETHKLPSRYKVTASSDGEVVNISMSGTKSVAIKASSLEDIKGVLSKFWPKGERMSSGATILLVDDFSGNGAKIKLGSLIDLVRVVDDLNLIDDPEGGSEDAAEAAKPEEDTQEAITASMDTPLETSSEPSSETTDEKPKRGRPRKVASDTAAQPKKPRGRPRKDQSAASADESATAAPKKRGRPRKEETSSGTTEQAPARRGKPPKASSSSLLDSAPAWFGKNFDAKYDGTTPGGGRFSLEKVPLKLEKPGSNKVTGIAKEPQEVMAWGYDIRSGGRHLAWVVASGPTALNIVSDDGSYVVPHGSISEVLTTIATRATQA